MKLNPDLSVVEAYEIAENSATMPWYAIDMIELNNDYFPVLHASPRDANYNLLDNSYPILFTTTRSDSPQDTACAKLTVLKMLFDTNAVRFTTHIMGISQDSNQKLVLNYMKSFTGNYAKIGVANTHVTQYMIPANFVQLTSSCTVYAWRYWNSATGSYQPVVPTTQGAFAGYFASYITKLIYGRVCYTSDNDGFCKFNQY